MTRSAETAGLKTRRTAVVTGSSGGIGSAIAKTLAAAGFAVVVHGRGNLAGAEATAEAIRNSGGEAKVLLADLADSQACVQFVEQAFASFGGVDVWINNAGLGVFGRYDETDFALHRQTIEVNLMGAMHGAAAALPRFVRQGSGVLINNVSLGAWSPTPFAAAYTASKFGLRGFTASLRQEMADHPRIHVCGVFPAVVDTPAFAHAANSSGRELDPGPMLYRPEDVAETFVSLVRRPRAEVTVGWPAAASKLAYAAAPRLTERAINRAMRAGLETRKPAAPTDGTVLAPDGIGGGASGGWLQRKGAPSAGTLSTGFVVGAVCAVATGVLVARSQRVRKKRLLA